MLKTYNLSSPSLTVPLALLSSSIFIFSKNAHMYQCSSILTSTCILIALSIAISKLISFLFSKIKSNTLKIFFNIFVCYVTVELLWFILYLPLKDILPPIWQVRAVEKIASVLLMILFAYKLGYHVINTFFLVSLTIFLITGTARAIRDSVPDEAVYLKEIYTQHDMTAKPNIYMIFLESYHDTYTMEKAYHIDTNNITSFLNKTNFVTYKNCFSNSLYTLMSMADVFSMRHYENAVRGNEDDVMRTIRRLLGGGDGNALLSILKNNGYHTVFLTQGSSYYMWNKEKYLDEIDYDSSFNCILPIKELLFAKIWHKHGFPTQPQSKKFRGSLIDNVKTSINDSIVNNTPLFLCFEEGAVHTPTSREYSWARQKEWVASGQYQQKVKDSWPRITKIVTYIIDNDPRSIIVLMGDHGSMRLRYIENEVANGDINEVSNFLNSIGESLESWAKDRFGIMLAVRMPGGEKKDISYGYPISPVNLFRHIFAAVNDDPSLLNDRVPNISKLGQYTLVKEGVVQLSDSEDKQ